MMSRHYAVSIARYMIHLVISAIFSLQILSGQPATSPKRFEAVAVKPHLNTGTKPSPLTVRGGPGTPDPITWQATNIALVTLVTRAYRVYSYQLVIPSWAADEHFDVTARLPYGATDDELGEMVRTLLEERFGLISHHEERQIPVYQLTVLTSGHKMGTPSPDSDNPPPSSAPTRPVGPLVDHDGYPNITGGNGLKKVKHRARIEYQRISMDALARAMSVFMDRPVVDNTALKGLYRIRLSFVDDSPEAPDGPNIFEAAKAQLGLKLGPSTGKITFTIVDSLNKRPTEN